MDQIAQMLAKTEPGAGFVHIPSGPAGEPVRGFDPPVIEEFTAESCTVKMVNGFKQYTWHKVAHRSNERLDCLVYALAALVQSRVNLDKISSPLIVSEAKEQQPQQQSAKRPTWGVISRIPLPNDTDGREENARAFLPTTWEGTKLRGLKTNRVRLGVYRTDRLSGEGGLNPGVAGVDRKLGARCSVQ